MKTIIVPTDFSESSANTIEFATHYAKKLGANILVFHAYHFPVADPIKPIYASTGTLIPASEIMDDHRTMITARLEEICKEITDKSSGSVSCTPMTISGLFVNQVLETIEQEDVSLVIMGARGASKEKELFIGSNTTHVVQKAKCPVLVIPNEAEFTEVDNVIYATDFLESDIKSIKKLLNIVGQFQPKIILLHIGDSGDEDEADALMGFRELVQENTDYDNMIFEVVNSKDVLEGIEAAAVRYEADLIAMTTLKRGFLSNMFHSSLTKKMVFHTDIPLLAFHES